jgi:hypothetical protein
MFVTHSFVSENPSESPGLGEEDEAGDWDYEGDYD